MVERMLIIMLLKLESNRCFLVKNVECKMQSLVGGKALAFYLNKLMAFYKILKSEICTAFWH